MDESEVKGVSADIVCEHFSPQGWTRESIYAPSEMNLTIYVNSQELVSIICTPTKINCLVVGFLYAEGIISGMKDVAMARICEDDRLADIRLSDPDYRLPAMKRTLTPGCGGGSTFRTYGEKVDSALVVAPEVVLSQMKRLQERMELYSLGGGIHTSCLSDGTAPLVVTEDIGRHNTLDKIQGECLLREIPTKDGLILTTGRVSSEMLIKAARMQAPVVASRHTPTERAITLARELGIALIGRVHGMHMSVYSHPERLGRPAWVDEP